MQPGGATWPWPRPRGVLGTLPGSDGPSRSWRDPWTVPGSVSHQQPTAESLRELRQGSLSICSTRGSWRSVRRGEMRRKGYVWSIEGGWNGFSTLEIQTPVEEQGCSRLSSHNFVWHPRGGRGAPVPTPERSGRALLAELLGSSSSGLWQPAGIQDLSQCPLSLDPLQLSGSAALAAVGSIPVGMMIHWERPLLHGWM